MYTVDGWLFQMISWLQLANQYKGDIFFQQSPHSQPSMHGIDGFAVKLTPNNTIERIVITEDKCTENAKTTIRDKVWPPNSDRKKSIAFVAATARKLLFKIKDVQEDEVLDLNYIPSDLYASLLYVISGNFADAQEVAEGFSIHKETDKYTSKLYKAVKLLVNSNLRSCLNLFIINCKSVG